MSGTPNYGYEANFLDQIDRDMKRVEDKADQNTATKVDKAEGQSLISSDRLEQITHNQNHIECLSTRLAEAKADIADRYTKAEVDTKLECKASKCELENHIIDPHAHQELFDRKVDKQEGYGLVSDEDIAQISTNKDDIAKTYTQGEVDALLANKVNRQGDNTFALRAASGGWAPQIRLFDADGNMRGLITLDHDAKRTRLVGNYAGDENWDQQLYYGTGSGYFWHGSTHALPSADNVRDIGNASLRIRNIYVVTSPIVGSDKRSKKDISLLEISLITKLLMSILAVQYRLIGGESGRFHYGFLAQDVENALTESELMGMDFAGFIKSPVLNDDGHETGDYIYALRLEEFIPILWAHSQDVERRLQAAGI